MRRNYFYRWDHPRPKVWSLKLPVIPTLQEYRKERMVDDPQAQNTPVKEQQDSAMPTEAQKAPDTEVVVEADSQSAPSTSTPEEGLPVDTSDRTRREFDKLQQKLREERAQREYYQNVFNSLQAKQPEQQSTPVYDPDTGLINEDVLTDVQRRAYEAEQRASRAESAVQSYLQEQENRTTYSSHPELDPNGEKFDQNLHNLTRGVLLDSMVNPQNYGGKQLSFSEAAEMAKDSVGKAAQNAGTQAVQQELENVAPKEQASLEATGSSGRRTAVNEDFDSLVQASRQPGKKGEEAIAARLRMLDKSQ